MTLDRLSVQSSIPNPALSRSLVHPSRNQRNVRGCRPYPVAGCGAMAFGGVRTGPGGQQRRPITRTRLRIAQAVSIRPAICHRAHGAGWICRSPIRASGWCSRPKRRSASGADRDHGRRWSNWPMRSTSNRRPDSQRMPHSNGLCRSRRRPSQLAPVEPVVRAGDAGRCTGIDWRRPCGSRARRASTAPTAAPTRDVAGRAAHGDATAAAAHDRHRASQPA